MALIRDRPKPRASAAASIAVLLAACIATAAGVRLVLANWPAAPWSQVAACVLVVLLPAAQRQLPRRARRPGVRAAEETLLGAACVLPLALLPGASMRGVLAAVLTGTVVWFASRSGRVTDAILTLCSGFVVAWIGLVVLPSVTALVAGAGHLAATIVALTLLHGRETVRDTLRRARHPRGAEAPEPEVLRRVVVGAGLTVSVTLVAALLLRIQLVILDASVPKAALEAETTPSVAEPATQRGAGPARVRGGGARFLGAVPFPAGLPAGLPRRGALNQSILDVRVLRRREPRSGLGGQPFLLRGNALERLTGAGFEPAGGNADVIMGRPGERIVLDRAFPDDVVLEIRQAPLQLERVPGVLLLVVEPTLAIAVDDRTAATIELRRRWGAAWTRSGAAGWTTYRVSSHAPLFPLAHGLEPAGRALLAGRAARHPDAGVVGLPPEWEGRRRAILEARALVHGAGSDLERVTRVIRWLKDLRYDAGRRFEGGLEGVTSLLRERSGICSHFAVTATVLLRAVGLPARVATGYLVSHHDPASQAYEVWETDRHAWTEVHFEGIGWVAFDATPPSVEPALAWLRDEGGAASPDGSAGAPPGTGPPRTLEEVVLEPFTWIAGAARAVIERPLAALGALVALLLLVWVGRPVVRGLAPRTGGTPAPAGTLDARLVTALAAHGHRRAATQTPREFAAAIARQGGPVLARLPEAVELLYRVRFGGRALNDGERAFLDDLVRMIVRMPRRPGVNA